MFAKSFTLSWQMSLSYRNQSIDLLCRPMDWFLYDRDPNHERVTELYHILENCSSCIDLIFTSHLALGVTLPFIPIMIIEFLCKASFSSGNILQHMKELIFKFANLSIAEPYLESSRTSMMVLFCKYICKNSAS